MASRRAWAGLVFLAFSCGSESESDAPDTQLSGDAGTHHDVAVVTDASDATLEDASANDAGTPDAFFPDGATDAQPDAQQKSELRVLFIGNSLTYVNDLPGTLSKMAAGAESPIAITVGEHAIGGASWEDHDVDPAVQPLIQQGWDYVVLQDQSAQPWLWWLPGIKPALVSLNDKIVKTGAKTQLYMTWAYDVPPNADPTRFAMDMAVNQYYERHAGDVGASVAPVGRAWERALRDPSMTLHAADGIHPNERGTYLAACVFYSSLTGLPPTGLGSGGLAVSSDDRSRLQHVAWDTWLARQRLQSPVVGAWALTGDPLMQDFVPTDDLNLGEGVGLFGGTQFGPGKYAGIPYFTGLNATKFTIAMYAYRSDWSVTPAGIYETLVSKSWGYELAQNDHNLEAKLYTTGVTPNNLTYSTAELATGWHHLALTYDGATFSLWVDDDAVASAPASGDVRYYPLQPDNSRYDAIAVGAHTVDTALDNATSAPFFTGAMSDLRLFDQALTQTELQNL